MAKEVKKFEQSQAAQCRYGKIASIIWTGWNLLWEDSQVDYQGHATFLVEKDGQFCFYEWSYGSCSGCDVWEGDGLTGKQVEEEMRRSALWMKSEVELRNWLNMLEGSPQGSSYKPMESGRLGGDNASLYVESWADPLMDRINAIRSYFKIEPITKAEVDAIVLSRREDRKAPAEDE